MSDEKKPFFYAATDEQKAEWDFSNVSGLDVEEACDKLREAINTHLIPSWVKDRPIRMTPSVRFVPAAAGQNIPAGAMVSVGPGGFGVPVPPPAPAPAPTSALSPELRARIEKLKASVRPAFTVGQLVRLTAAARDEFRESFRKNAGEYVDDNKTWTLIDALSQGARVQEVTPGGVRVFGQVLRVEWVEAVQ